MFFSSAAIIRRLRSYAATDLLLGNNNFHFSIVSLVQNLNFGANFGQKRDFIVARVLRSSAESQSHIRASTFCGVSTELRKKLYFHSKLRGVSVSL